MGKTPDCSKCKGQRLGRATQPRSERPRRKLRWTQFSGIPSGFIVRREICQTKPVSHPAPGGWPRSRDFRDLGILSSVTSTMCPKSQREDKGSFSLRLCHGAWSAGRADTTCTSHLVVTGGSPGWPAPLAADLFVKVLEQVRQRYQWVVVGYVVMPEHIHLLVSEPPQRTLSTAIQALKLGFARRVLAEQRRRRRSAQTDLFEHSAERVWQTRYYDFNVCTARKRVEKLRYMHRNPVKRALGKRRNCGAGAVSAVCLPGKRARPPKRLERPQAEVSRSGSFPAVKCRTYPGLENRETWPPGSKIMIAKAFLTSYNFGSPLRVRWRLCLLSLKDGANWPYCCC